MPLLCERVASAIAEISSSTTALCTASSAFCPKRKARVRPQSHSVPPSGRYDDDETLRRLLSRCFSNHQQFRCAKAYACRECLRKSNQLWMSGAREYQCPLEPKSWRCAKGCALRRRRRERRGKVQYGLRYRSMGSICLPPLCP